MPAERQYITWDDVAQLMEEVEEEYGCRLVLTGVPQVGSTRGSLYWRIDAYGRAGANDTPSAWVGGTLRQWNSKTVPGMMVGMLTTLGASIENQRAYAALTPLELELGA